MVFVGTLKTEVSFGTAVSECHKRLINVLAKDGDKDSIEEIITYLNDRDPALIAHAAEVLGERGFTEAILPLEEVLEHDHEEVRAAVRQALEKIQQGKASSADVED